MTRNNVVGIVAVVVVLLLFGGYATLRPVPAKAPGTATVLALPAGKYAEHAAYDDIVANYATSTQLSGSANTAAIALMKNFVADTITQFKENFTNLTPNEMTKIMGFDKSRKWKLQIVYLIASSAHTVSYIFTMYEDTLGAHGNTFFKTFTFDTGTGATLSLADIFLPGTPYLDTLSSLSRAKLPGVIGQNASTDSIKGGTTPDAKNFENFFFDNRDFVILFPAYAVAAYSDGSQTLRIPISNLSSILKADYR